MARLASTAPAPLKTARFQIRRVSAPVVACALDRATGRRCVVASDAMPFKSVTSPRPVLTMEGHVCASAKLQDPSLVAMLSTDPVKLVLHPTSGGSSRTTGVGLGTADEVALLSREIAVVRSGDEIWALQNLSHNAVMDQVGRDARQLCMRAAGQTALVVHWDGRATELRVGRNEVIERPFALRGTVRVCDVGPSDTFVVVDGTDGGELRVHPGATPEAGASGRGQLPREAKELDRLRGGRDLSALFKRGKTSVCIVRPQGSGLTAKMIELELPPLDVGVVETSLFATFADGTFAIYDKESLSGATGSPTPTASIRLPARGEPRTMVFTGKSVPTGWIGTSSGEVVQVTVVRKGPSI